MDFAEKVTEINEEPCEFFGILPFSNCRHEQGHEFSFLYHVLASSRPIAVKGRRMHQGRHGG